MSTPDYQAGNQWTGHFAGHFANHALAYPAEYVIRIFRGSYPHLAMPKPQSGQSVLDVGCGDGRHLPFFASLGLDAHGVEIAAPIVEQLRGRLAPLGIAADRLRVGSCASLPFADATFDYVMAWNSAYYMSLDGADFTAHAAELTRVLRPGGWLVISVPKPSAFIFAGSEPAPTPGCRIVRQDPFGVRNGEMMRVFQDGAELAAAFATEYDTFCHADIHDDCFGFAYHWFLLVARKKETAA
ncbi:MAG: class I SAM-dependent methyltransferase [Pseudomonadota bacterium]|nr:class I SAM-dependent methyltransferase [Pseudomonadota bacterium]MDP1905975.1 class I SAM-dependent methyltransferase [Pseudomonadota bacterium]MDP2351893.1 class I SAM-dependent methyltransferase [Pseudomonadota bacterium]